MLGIEEAWSVIVDEERKQVSGVGECNLAGRRIKDGIDHGDKFPRRKVFHQQAVEFGQHLSRRTARFCQGPQHRARGRHEQGCRCALSGDIGKNQSPAAIREGDEVVPISAHGAGGNAEAGDSKTRNVRRSLGQKSLLNGASFLNFPTHRFALVSLRLEAARIIDGDGHVIAQGLKDSKLLAEKGIQVGVRSGEYSYQALADAQWNRHLRAGGFLAGDIILIFPDIWRVAHLSRGGYVAHHPLLANLQPETLAVHGTTVHAAHHHFSASFIVKIDGGLQKTEGMRYLIDDIVNQLIEIENRTDLMRSLLEFLQALYLGIDLRMSDGQYVEYICGK